MKMKENKNNAKPEYKGHSGRLRAAMRAANFTTEMLVEKLNKQTQK